MTARGTQRPDVSDHLRSRLATLPQAPVPPDQAEAAVLILLRTGKTGLEVLAEQRAERAGDPWSGQVGLPGGRTSPADGSLTETVLRELQEEVGVIPSALEGPPGLFDIRRARPSGLRVAVFAHRVGGDTEIPSPASPTEVDATFWMPLSALDHATSRPRNTLFGRINVAAVEFEGHVVWGFTLRVLQDFVAWLGSSEAAPPKRPEEQNPWRGQAL